MKEGGRERRKEWGHGAKKRKEKGRKKEGKARVGLFRRRPGIDLDFRPRPKYQIRPRNVRHHAQVKNA